MPLADWQCVESKGRAHLLLVRGADGARKTRCIVEPSFVNAYFSIDPDDLTFADVNTAIMLLRNLYGHGKDTDSIRDGSIVKTAQDTVHDDKEAVLPHGDDEARVALALARPVSLDMRDDAPEIEVVSSEQSELEPPEEEEEDSDSGSEGESDSDGEVLQTVEEVDEDEDTDSDSADDDEDDEEEERLRRQTSSFFNHTPLRRSPLSQDEEGSWPPIYEGYHCTIPGCDFAASTSAHVRHHMMTASHWYLLDIPEN